MNERVLVADSIAREGLDLLAQRARVDERPGLSPDALIAAIPDYDALVVRSETKVTRAVIEAGAKLRVIARAGVGVDNIDVDAATERGIVVVNAPAGNTVSAAELAVALLMALARRLPQADSSLRQGAWDRGAFVGVELRGKVAGVIGLGRVGAAVARRLHALEMTVLACDPYVPDEHARMLGGRTGAAGGAAQTLRLHHAAHGAHHGDGRHHRARADRADEARRPDRQHGPRRTGGRDRALGGAEHGTPGRRSARCLRA